MLAEIGDQIKVGNTTETISEILSQDDWEDRGGLYIEFKNADGKYRYWKQGPDGGQLIRRAK